MPVGGVIDSADSSLFVVEDLDSLIVRVNVPERELSKLSVGQVAELSGFARCGVTPVDPMLLFDQVDGSLRVPQHVDAEGHRDFAPQPADDIGHGRGRGGVHAEFVGPVVLVAEHHGINARILAGGTDLDLRAAAASPAGRRGALRALLREVGGHGE